MRISRRGHNSPRGGGGGIGGCRRCGWWIITSFSILLISLTYYSNSNNNNQFGNSGVVLGFVVVSSSSTSSPSNSGSRNYLVVGKKKKRFVGIAAAAAAATTTAAEADEGVATTAEEEGTSTTSVLQLPTWDDMASSLQQKGEEQEPTQPPVVTLYRDTNGWCPFCERVWLCLRAKGIPYRERLINLRDKPDWFLELVPTGLVPAILIHDDIHQTDDGETTSNDSPAEDDNENKPPPVRRLVWESLDIMEALDETFPNTPRLVFKDKPEYLEARNQASALTSAGFMYTSGARNSSKTSEEINDLKQDFEKELDALDQSIKSHGGPFRLGSQFSGIDAEIVPTLERWVYQLPITTHDDGFDILNNNRPYLQNWFDAMNQYEPYYDRVAGDEYSWAAVSSTFLRYFGGDEETNPELKATIDKADMAASKLVNNFVNTAESVIQLSSTSATVQLAVKDAAKKLISNHEAVIKDCTNQEPKSQTHVPRASDPEAADLILRHVANILLQSAKDGGDENANNNVLEIARRSSVEHIINTGKSSKEEAALAAKTVAMRICTPRDMSAPAAILLRGVLMIVADQLLLTSEEEAKN